MVAIGAADIAAMVFRPDERERYGGGREKKRDRESGSGLRESVEIRQKRVGGGERGIPNVIGVDGFAGRENWKGSRQLLGED